MSIQTIKAGSRYYRVVPATALMAGAPLIELGPGTSSSSVGCFVVQFNPNAQWDGQFIVMGRTFGTAADSVDVPFVPLPYRRVVLGDVASDYALVADPISTQAIIQVPCNGLSVAFAFTCLAGYCDLTSWDLQGSSAI